MRALKLPRPGPVEGMGGGAAEGVDIRAVVVEASLALSRLDAGRLEELASACRALDCDLNRLAEAPGRLRNDAPAGAALLGQARAAVEEMRVFRQVLEATRANLAVMKSLVLRRGARLEYSEAQARGWAPAEPGYGDN